MTTITRATLAILTLATCFATPAFAQDKEEEWDTQLWAYRTCAAPLLAEEALAAAKAPLKTARKGLKAAVKGAWEVITTDKTVDEVTGPKMGSKEWYALKCREYSPLSATYVDSPKKFFLGLSVWSTCAWIGLSFLTLFVLLTTKDFQKRWVPVCIALAIGRTAIFLLDDQIFHGTISQYWLIPLYLGAVLIPFGYSKVKLGSWTKFFGTRHPPPPPADEPATSDAAQCPQCNQLSLEGGICLQDCGYGTQPSAPAPAPAPPPPPPKREYSLPPPEHRQRRRV